MATTRTRDAAFPEPPYPFSDQAGRDHTVEVHDDDPALLEALYEQLDDESRAQGIPSRSAKRRTEWTEELLEGHNVVAWHDGDAVGHAVLMPYEDASAATKPGLVLPGPMRRSWRCSSAWSTRLPASGPRSFDVCSSSEARSASIGSPWSSSPRTRSPSGSTARPGSR